MPILQEKFDSISKRLAEGPVFQVSLCMLRGCEPAARRLAHQRFWVSALYSYAAPTELGEGLGAVGSYRHGAPSGAYEPLLPSNAVKTERLRVNIKCN